MFIYFEGKCKIIFLDYLELVVYVTVGKYFWPMPAGFLILDASIDWRYAAETTVQQSSGDQSLVSVPVLAKTEQLMIQNDEIF